MSNPLTPGNSGWMPNFEDPEMPPAKEKAEARRSAAACSPQDLAARIATDLFSNAFGDQGTRLEIKQSNGPASERSLGGWCYVAAVDRIADIIKENAGREASVGRGPNQTDG